MQKLTQNRPKPTCEMQNMVIHGSVEELLNSLHIQNTDKLDFSKIEHVSFSKTLLSKYCLWVLFYSRDI